MRVVQAADAIEPDWALCQGEAQQAFGNPALYVQRLFPRARHIEVQVLSDGSGAVSHLWERECSLQRQRQKLVEIAPLPAPGLHPAVRQRLLDAALAMARAVRYRNLGTFEFLVDATQAGPEAGFAFIAANARL